MIDFQTWNLDSLKTACVLFSLWSSNITLRWENEKKKKEIAEVELHWIIK